MELKLCPFCGGVAEMTFKWPIYGAGGCEIKCIRCGTKVNDFGYSETHFDKATMTLSTPVTPDAIRRCIERAVKKWNRRVGEGEKDGN